MNDSITGAVAVVVGPPVVRIHPVSAVGAR